MAKENVENNEAKKEEQKMGTLFLERKEYGKEGLHVYFVKISFMGKPFEASMQPDDVSGYQLLDSLFGDSNKVPLRSSENSITDSETGEVRKFRVYEAYNVDENGDEWTTKVNPRNKSDKQALEQYFTKVVNK